MWTGQAHEINVHSGLGALRPFKIRHLAGREPEFCCCTETDGLFPGIGETANSLPVRQQAAEKANLLEEIEGERLFAQRFLELCEFRLFTYNRIFMPVRGGHWRRISFLWRVVTLNWLKLLSVTYWPRKFSITLANR